MSHLQKLIDDKTRAVDDATHLLVGLNLAIGMEANNDIEAIEWKYGDIGAVRDALICIHPDLDSDDDGEEDEDGIGDTIPGQSCQDPLRMLKEREVPTHFRRNKTKPLPDVHVGSQFFSITVCLTFICHQLYRMLLALMNRHPSMSTLQA